MNFVVYNSIPCPILKFEEPDSYLILYKNNQKWIYKYSKGYGEIKFFINYKIYINMNKNAHRDYDLPAIIWKDGTKHWLNNDVYHRLNGPALEYRINRLFNQKDYVNKQYWIEGVQYSKIIYWFKIYKRKIFKNEKI